MTNKAVPDRVMNFGSDSEGNIPLPKETITPDNLDSHAESLPRPTGYRILILPFTLPEVTKGGIHIAKATLDKRTTCNCCWLCCSNGSRRLRRYE